MRVRLHVVPVFFYYQPCATARVAELADAPDLGSGAVRRKGSSPFSRTTDGKSIADARARRALSRFAPGDFQWGFRVVVGASLREIDVEAAAGWLPIAHYPQALERRAAAVQLLGGC